MSENCTLDVNPETAVSVIRGSPYPVTAEEVIAIQFPDIGRVILEPFQVDLAYSLDCMGFVLVEFAEIETEMTMVPIR